MSRLAEISQQMVELKEQRARTLEQLRDLDQLRGLKLITAQEYLARSSAALEGKSEDEYFSEIDRSLERERQRLRALERQPIRAPVLIILLAVFLAALLITPFLLQLPSPTGFVTYKPGTPTELELNATFNQSGNITLNLSGLTSFKLSGSVEGSGYVQVFLVSGGERTLVYHQERRIPEQPEIPELNRNETNRTPENSTTGLENETSLNSTEEETFTEFSEACEDTCSLDNVTADGLEIVLDRAVLRLELAIYTQLQENKAPRHVKNIPDLEFSGEYSLNISGYFSDEDDDNLSFAITPNPYIRLQQSKGRLHFKSMGFPGSYRLTLTASDGYSQGESNEFTITVLNESDDVLNRTVVQGAVSFSEPVSWVQTLVVENSQERGVEKQVEFSTPREAVQITVTELETNTSVYRGDITIESVTGEELTYAFAERFRQGEVKGYLITYTTPGPTLQEEQVSEFKKLVTVSSETNYTNITASADIAGYPARAIKVHWLTEQGKLPVDDVLYEDFDNDTLIDRIQWTVPHLSNQSYEIDIVILNLQSYPTVGGNWTVLFETVGEANLTITASNGTTYNDSPHDLTPLELACNGKVLDYIWQDSSAVSHANYSCNSIGSWTVRVNTAGSHHQEFEFGNVTAWAHNLATNEMNQNLSNVSNGTFVGEDGGDWTGYSVANVGDVNGDGHEDLAIGAPYDEEAGNADQGQVYLILGGQALSANRNLSDFANGSYWGEDGSDLAGFAVAGAGDVNKDGFDDFLIGAPGDEEGSSASTGQAYLILGGQGWAMNRNLSDWSNGSFFGGDGGDQAGFSLAGAGDVNGDGYADFLIGAPADEAGGTNRGQTLLILGGQAWAMGRSLNNTNASYFGGVNSDFAGDRVAGIGDVNKDGYDDFLIGAMLFGVSFGLDRGITYMILGGQGWAMNRSLSSNRNASWQGEDTSDYLGRDIAGVGDINADGYDDFFLGAYRDEEPTADFAGQGYLILGGQGWATGQTIGSTTANGSYWGETGNDNSSMALAGVGDVNSDGFADFIIGAPNDAEGSQQGAGQAYVILGGQSWAMDRNLSNESNSSFWGEDGTDYAAFSIAGIGDFNRDYAPDFAIGAPGDEEGSNNQTGQVYVVYGDSKTPPASVTGVDVKADSTYGSSATYVNLTSHVYVQVQGTDGNSLIADAIMLNASTTSDKRGITFLAVETGVNTGTYQGSFYLRAGASNRQFKKLMGANGDTLNIALLNGSSTGDAVPISDPCTYTSGTLIVASTISCVGSAIRVTNLTINSGGKLFLNGSNLTVDGNAIIQNNGLLDVVNSRGTVWYNGVINVYGDVNYTNVTVRFNGTSDGASGMNVTNTASVWFNSSNITNGDTVGANYYIWVMNNSNFSIGNSYMSYAGYSDVTYGSSQDKDVGLSVATTGAVIRNTTFQNNLYDITLWNSNNSFIHNNTFTSQIYGYSIVVYGNSYWGKVWNNYVNTGAAGGSALWCGNCHNFSVDRNQLVTGSVDTGIYQQASHNNNYTYNNLSATSNTAFKSLNSNATFLSYNNFTSIGSGYYGADFSATQVPWNTGIRDSYLAGASGGLFIQSKTNNTDVTDTIIMGPSGGNDLVISNSAGSHLSYHNFANVTFVRSGFSVGTNAQIYVRYYLDVQVNDSLNAPVQSATVTVYNNSGTADFSDTTNSTGQISRRNVTYFTQKGTTREYYSNYTVNATKTGYDEATYMLNITNSLKVNLTLTNPCYQVSGNWTVPARNLYCANTTIKADNVTINDSANVTFFQVNFTFTNILIKNNALLDIVNSSNLSGYGIWANGNITVNGTLNLTNMTMRFNGTCDGCSGINVTEIGRLNINSSSNLTNGWNTANNYFITVYPGGNFSMGNSFMSYAGWDDQSGGIDLDPAMGLLLFSNNSVVRGNIFQTNFYDITLWNANNTLIHNNTFTNQSVVGTSTGIVAYGGAAWGTVSSNYFNLDALVVGISCQSCANFSFRDNYLKVGSQFITLSGSHDNNFTNNNATTGRHTFYAVDESNRNRIVNSNFTSTAATWYGAYFLGGNDNFINMSYLGGVGGGLYLKNPTNRTTVIDSVLQSAGGIDLTTVNNAGISSHEFINTSFPQSTFLIGTSTTIFVKYYLDVQVKDGYSNVLQNANVTVQNRSMAEEFWTLTSASGTITRRNLTHYSRTGNTFTYYTNYTINASKYNYTSATRNHNLTSSVNLSFVISIIANVTENVNLTPTFPRTFEDLNCSFVLIDVDNGTIFANWTFYRNDTALLRGTKTVTNNTNQYANLSYSLLGNGDRFRCEITAFDGLGYGNSVNSSAVTVVDNVTCGEVISAEGSYVVNSSISNYGSGQDYTCIKVNASDVRLNCQGYAVDANCQPGIVGEVPAEYGTGIYLAGASGSPIGNINVSNCKLTEFYRNVLFEYVENSTVMNSNLSAGCTWWDTNYGTDMLFSTNAKNITTSNIGASSAYGYQFSGDSGYHQLSLANYTGTGTGYYFQAGGTYSLIKNSTLQPSTVKSGTAFTFSGSQTTYNINVTNVTILDFAIAMNLSSANNVNVSNTTFKNNTRAVLISGSSDNSSFIYNTFINNSEAVQFTGTSNDDNRFYNNFFNNTVNVNLSTGNNATWNTSNVSGTNIIGGLRMGGNFWANWTNPGQGHSESCADVDGDGFCDSVFQINQNNTDFLPLTSNNPTPVIRTSRMTPITAYKNDTLLGYCNATDANLDRLVYFFNWYLNGTLNSSGTWNNGSNNNQQGVEVNVANISTTLLFKSQNWTLECRASDLTTNSSWMNSSTVTIQNYVPTVPTLTNPTHGNTTVRDRYPTFNWTTSTDADGDTIYYHFDLYTESACNSGGFNTSGITSLYYTSWKMLCTQSETTFVYNWTVQACDNWNCSANATRFNFSIQPYITINLSTSSIDFGSMDLGEWNDTADDNPAPFLVENLGNVNASLINITANASLWQDSSAGLGTWYLTMKAANSTEPGSFNWTASTTAYTPITSSNQSIISTLDWNTSRNSAELDINVSVPMQEPAGNKSVNILFWFEETPYG